MEAKQNKAPWTRLIELAILFSFGVLIFTLYALGYLDRILGITLTLWFFSIILTIVILVEAFAFVRRKVDAHFWSWFTTGLGMLGTVLGFSMALAGIDVSALQDPATLTMEIGQFLKSVAFAIDTTMIGLSGAMIIEAMNKIREMLYGHGETEQAVAEEK